MPIIVLSSVKYVNVPDSRGFRVAGEVGDGDGGLLAGLGPLLNLPHQGWIFFTFFGGGGKKYEELVDRGKNMMIYYKKNANIRCGKTG